MVAPTDSGARALPVSVFLCVCVWQDSFCVGVTSHRPPRFVARALEPGVRHRLVARLDHPDLERRRPRCRGAGPQEGKSQVIALARRIACRQGEEHNLTLCMVSSRNVPEGSLRVPDDVTCTREQVLEGSRSPQPRSSGRGRA